MSLLRKAALAALPLAALTACAPRMVIDDRVAPSPSSYWVPPAAEKRVAGAVSESLAITDEMRSRKWSLADVIDLALKNNPATRQSWEDARAAAARLGMADGAEYPKLSLDASSYYKYLHRNDTDVTSKTASFNPAINLSYLLFDFGARDANIKAASETLLAANWTQNKVVQDTILGTQRAYYLYLATKAVREARLKNLERAELALKIAKARQEAGVATISDVLSAKSSVSQAKLALETAEGQISTTRGSLAVAMGLPSNTPYDIENLPADIPYGRIGEEVEALIEKSLKARPDLMAARAGASAARENITKALSDDMPTLTLSAQTGLNFLDYNKAAVTPANGDRREENYFAGVIFTYPLFTGYTSKFNIERARAEAKSADEKTRAMEQIAVNQVFTAYHILNTAAQKVKTSDDFVESAQRLEEVALGRYNEGVGTMLDLVTAQATLAEAKTQSIQARWEWHTALAQLAHDTGVTGLRGENGLSLK